MLCRHIADVLSYCFACIDAFFGKLLDAGLTFFNRRDPSNKAALAIERQILVDLGLSTGANIDSSNDIREFVRRAKVKLSSQVPNTVCATSDSDGMTSLQLQGVAP